jgi:hypothetical protein
MIIDRNKIPKYRDIKAIRRNAGSNVERRIHFRESARHVGDARRRAKDPEPLSELKFR